MSIPNINYGFVSDYAQEQRKQRNTGLWRDIASTLVSGIPVVGSIASGMLQRHWATKDVANQNLYNTPKEQVKRLREAGLPLASMFSGSGASVQSDLPRSSEIDPTLGTARGIENYFQNRLMKMQLQLQEQALRLGEENIKKTGAEANLAQGEADYWSRLDPMGREGATNQFTYLESKKQQQMVREWIDRHKNTIIEMESAIMDEMKRQGLQIKMVKGKISLMNKQGKLMGLQGSKILSDMLVNNQRIRNMQVELTKLLQATANLKQQYRTRELERIVNQATVDAIASGRPLTGLIGQLIYKLSTKSISVR